jgi:HlyD family secretion protein
MSPDQTLAPLPDTSLRTPALEKPPSATTPSARRRKRPITIAIALVALGAVGIALNAARSKDPSQTRAREMATAPVRSGPLTIDVLEGGNVRALESLVFSSEIEASAGTKILSIVEEGYMITQQDVADQKVIVRLDDNSIREAIAKQELDYQSALADYAEGDLERTIQESEGQSLIRAAKQAARFALLDFEKYMGQEVARRILIERSLPFDNDSLEAFVEELDAYELSLADRIIEEDGTIVDSEPISLSPFLAGDVEDAARLNFLKYIEGDELGDGEAQQRMRALQDQLLVSKNEMSLAAETFEGSQRLAEKKYITRNSLENDKINLDKTRLSLQTAETDLDLFLNYEFPKLAEESLTKYEEALRDLQRKKRSARIQMEKKESAFLAAKRRFEVQQERFNELKNQLEATEIKAQRTGLVAYGGPSTNYYLSRSQEPISEGSTVSHRQPIITIPDMGKLAVDVSIHESYVKRVSLGQKARIVVDAEPDKTLNGEIAEMAVLPDSTNMRYNPNHKVYPAVVRIEGAHEWLKPGMSARVIIIVEEIEQATFVPVQAIHADGDRNYCYVKSSGRPEERTVKTGPFNDEFIVITEGLDPGEEVYLGRPLVGGHGNGKS